MFEVYDSNLEHNAAGSTDPRVDVLVQIFSQLEESGVTYAVIHGSGEAFPDVASDVDIAFQQDPRQAIEPILLAMAGDHKLVPVQRLHYEVPYGYYYILLIGSRHFLHLDCLYDPIGINRYHLQTPFLLQGRVRASWGYRVDRDREALYVLIKRTIKGSLSSRHITILKDVFSDRDSIERLQIKAWFGKSSTRVVSNIIASENEKKASHYARKLYWPLQARYWFRHPVRLFVSCILHCFRAIRRIWSPSGIFVCVLGPDGSGKSTVTEAACQQLSRAFRRTWRFHWRPNLLPKLSKTKPNSSGSQDTATPPADQSAYRGVVSYARFFYYWLDFVIGYWVVIFPRKVQTTLILGERYFPDVMVHPERYGFSVSSRLIGFAARFVPNPDLVVLLKADPSVIYSRKPELPITTITTQLSRYEAELPRWGNHVTVDTEDSAEYVARDFSNSVVDVCAGRSMSWLAADGARNKWRGFPAATNAKIWIDESDTFCNAMNLYHPYSHLGQLARATVRILPDRLNHLIFDKPPTINQLELLDCFKKKIQEIFKSANLTISFSTGTPGPHRKITAQVSHESRVIAYVKIANSEAAKSLLRQESDALKWGAGETDIPVIIPKVLGEYRVNDYLLLCLSAPEEPGFKRELSTDNSDIAFLDYLIPEQESYISVDAVLDEIAVRYSSDYFLMDDESKKVLKNTVREIKSSLVDGLVKVGPEHGDYAPWNTLKNKDGELYVFDWEYSHRASPILGDILHYTFMTQRLVKKSGPEEVIRYIFSLLFDQHYRSLFEKAKVSRAEYGAYLLLYLLRQAGREGENRNSLPIYLRTCIEVTLLALEKPGAHFKILVSAYACDPKEGSEPGVGWNWVTQISRHQEAWVITRRNNRERIEAALAENPNPFLHFEYVDLPRWASFWKKKQRGVRTYYYLWQFAALFRARQLRRDIKFDFAHHVTFVNDWLWTFLALTRIPFVWGPIGSHPKASLQLLPHGRAKFQERIRTFVQSTMRCIDPLYWITVWRAGTVICINQCTSTLVPLRFLPSSRIIVEPAIAVEKPGKALPRNQSDVFKLLFVGRFAPVKAAHLAVGAMLYILERIGNAHLTLIGKGSEYLRLLDLVKKSDLQDSVTFVDWLPRSEILRRMHESDVFIFPSMEGGGMVVLEAMRAGTPVVTLRYGGPGTMVTEKTGYRINASNYEQVLRDLAEAVIAIGEDDGLRHALGSAAMKRASDVYSWQAKGNLMRDVYWQMWAQNKIRLCR